MAYLGQGDGGVGSRRKMLKGYLKAANDLRQSYIQSYLTNDGGTEHRGEPEDGPGAFPDAAVVRNGNEEMILFPSYARRHVQGSPHKATTPGRELTEEELWKQEWDKHEDENAIVDVDVRGWIYTPHLGPSTRKQRMVISLARQLTGIPAPPSNRPEESPSSSRASSPSGNSRVSPQEQDLISFEAENIVRKGDQEERFPEGGAFSERPSYVTDVETMYGDEPSPRGRQQVSQSVDHDITMPIQKTASWEPKWEPKEGRRSAGQLASANKHLLNRLKPFMANPLSRTPISAFFYNSEVSRQLTVYTDPSGHFNVRAALDFVPTHVRVLAGEKLSATEEVVVTSPKGVSLISDIDDTVKHSAICEGAREVFRNAFTGNHHEMEVEGVHEWYNTLHDMGVKLHYVSNAPWQMYPVLTSYFKLANLPKGSFHLKQYNSVLQAVFEPVAERKKSSLDKLMRDFPERKFVLVGDSGEADLEVYTETALENPGRIIGIFIRDVTTPVKTGYFDPSNGSDNGDKPRSRNQSRTSTMDALATSKRLSRPNDIRDDDADLKAALAASLADMEEDTRRARKSINPDAPSAEPPRTSHPSTNSTKPRTAPPEEDLIDFSEPASSQPRGDNPLRKPTSSHASYPPPPPKPAGLRSPAPDGTTKVPPPIPRKPSSVEQPSLQQPSTQTQTYHPSPLSQVTRQDSGRKVAPPLPARPRTYREMAQDTLAKARPVAGALWQSEAVLGQSRSPTGQSQPSSPQARPISSYRSVEDLHLPGTSSGRSPAPPPPPPRRTMTSTSSRPSTQRFPDSGWDGSDPAASSPGDVMTKRQFLWKQRWDTAKSLLERNGVTIRTWRKGEDVADVCVRLVEMELRKFEKESKSGR